MCKKSSQAIVFCNTLWFSLNFKYEVCERLLREYNSVKVIYLRKGPPHIKSKKKSLENNGCDFLSFTEYIIYRLKKIYKINKNSLLLTFTIGPILLGSLPIIFNQKRKIVVLEGLGRVFSSKKFIYKFLKVLLINIYRFIFYFSFTKIIVLNYTDFSYLLEENISPLSKLNIIPGTGINKNHFNIENIKKYKTNSDKKNWISYVGRIDKDKGFYSFIAAASYLINNNCLKNHKFVAICPHDDIKNLPNGFSEDLKNRGIFLYPYVPDILVYYCNIKILVIPTIYAEGLSRVALEATLLGIPVVGTFNRGVVSIVKNNYSGILLHDSSSYRIAFSVQEIVENYDYFVKNSKLHSNIIANRYGIEKSIKSLFDIISN